MSGQFLAGGLVAVAAFLLVDRIVVALATRREEREARRWKERHRA